jgi:hypothetical protein
VFFLNQLEKTVLDPKGLFQPCLKAWASEKAELSCWLRDGRGQLFRSPFIKIPKRTGAMKELGDFRSKAPWLNFAPVQTSLSSYKLVSGGRKVPARFPLKPYGLEIRTQGRQSKAVDIVLDEFAVWSTLDAPRLWRRDIRAISPYFMCANQMLRETLFSNSQAWGVSGVSGAAFKPNGSTMSETAMRSSMSRAKDRYGEAQSKFEALKKLDRKTEKTLADFFRDSAKVPQPGVLPEMAYFSNSADGLQLKLHWAEQPELKPYLNYGSSWFSISSLAQTCQMAELYRWIPLKNGICGMEIALWTSGFKESYLALVFEDESGRFFRRQFPVGECGQHRFRIPFSSSGFEILKGSGQKSKDQSEPEKLRFCRLELGHAPTVEKHGGEQELWIYPPKWLKEF